MPFEKIMNAIYEMWSKIMPERAIACAFNLEYLLTGGRDGRSADKPIFMFYDWLPGGWGGRNGKDGCNVTTACFGTGLMSQPVEGQERANPILTTEFEILKDSRRSREMARRRRRAQDLAHARGREDRDLLHLRPRARGRLGHRGRLALDAARPDAEARRQATPRNGSASIFSDVPIGAGDVFSRPTAGGGGFGDPLERDPALVLEDIDDDYVSVERAAKDYGVVVHTIDAELCDYEVDKSATEALRAKIRAERISNARLDPEIAAERYRSGELDTLDVIRRTP